MKSATLITTLTSLTTFMAVVAPVVVFGFLYVMRVQPERTAAARAQIQLASVRNELKVSAVSSPQIADARTAVLSRAGEFEAALVDLLKGPAVGGVSNLSVDRGAPVDDAGGPLAPAFDRPGVELPVTLTFTARYEQIGRFFWNLRELPTTWAVEAVELTPLTTPPLMRAKVSLVALLGQGAAGVKRAPRTNDVDVTTPPRWVRDPFANERPDSERPATHARVDPIVTSILFSGGRRVALVDGLVVGPGDRVRDGVVRSIEPDAIVIAGPDGESRRVEIARRDVRIAKP